MAATPIPKLVGIVGTKPAISKPKLGLRAWMDRVLVECDRAAAGFEADPVHDLRVALRRCRSLADGMRAIDPDSSWKDMKKAGKKLFQALGELRDMQVMQEWIEKLSDSHDPADSVAVKLLNHVHVRESVCKQLAFKDLDQFDRKQWRQWSRTLPQRASRVRPGSAVYLHLALEKWTAAYELHKHALRTRSQVSLHQLRIGIKRFRYTVENFLPRQHALWGGDLKELQDLLGEVHDLDVLWAAAVSCQVFHDANSRNRWHQRILSERSKRIEAYRAKMIGEDSLWQIWRAALPQGKQIAVLATRRMKLWATGLDPDFAHSERVASLALQLYDGLLAWGWRPAVDAASARSSLLAAALLHDVGKSEGQKGHHKATFDLIRTRGNPLGWKPGELQCAAVVARFHHGALPTRKHKTLRDLLPDEQKAAIQLAAVLRLANALDATHDGHIRRLQIENVQVKTRGNEALIITAEGYSPLGPSAQTIAAERHLLETVLHRPVVIKPMKNPLPRSPSRQIL